MLTALFGRLPTRFIALLIGPASAAVMLNMAPQAGMSAAAWKTTAVAVWMALWWVTEAVPIPVTALLPLLLMPVLGILSVTAATAPFANPVIYLFLGGFLLAAAFEGSGLHRRLALAMIARAGTRPDRIIAGFMATAGFISLWVSNTATVLIIYPLALSIADQARAAEPNAKPYDFEIPLLLSVAYAATIGGLGTLIGTPPNALLAAYLLESHGITVPFVRWMAVGVPIVVVGLPITWWLLTRVLYRVPRTELPIGAEIIASSRAALGSMTRAEKMVALVGVMTAVAWMTQPLIARVAPGVSDSTIAIAGSLVLLIVPLDRAGTRTLTWEMAERIPWGVLILFGGGLSLAAAIQESGLAAWIGGSVTTLKDLPPIVLTVIVTTIVIFLTELTSNTATAATFLPVVGSVAVGAGIDPLLLAVPAALAATCAFMLPVGTPPNAIVFGSGRLTIPQMARAGFLLNILFIVLITAATMLLVPSVLGSR